MFPIEKENPVRIITYTASPEDAGLKVQTFLQRRGYSVRLLRSLKQRAGAVLCNGAAVRMIDRLAPGDELTVSMEDAAVTEEAPTELRVPVVYEDDDLIVYNKPPFLATHPSNGHRAGTLAGVYTRDMRERGEATAVFRPVFRLDRDTDGLCVCAKTSYAAARLAGKVEKVYAAVACGDLPKEGCIDAPIVQLEPHRMRRGVREDGQRAVTHYRRLAGNGRFTLAEVRLETGRTHQIRVHFAYAGHPLAGDSLYGTGDDSGLDRQALSCVKVSFLHPVHGNPVHLCINIHDEFLKLVQSE